MLMRTVRNFFGRSPFLRAPWRALFSLFVLLPFHVHAQDAPKYSNEFLAIGVGARALGMGYAYTSACSDVTAGYWNPAGLLGVRGDLQIGAMHSEYFAGIAKYDYIGLAKPIDSASTIGFTFIGTVVLAIERANAIFTKIVVERFVAIPKTVAVQI